LRIPDIDEIFPQTSLDSTTFLGLPLPASRKKSQRPTASRLVKSARERAALLSEE
jgi:hypothetical protein